jgi:HPt (histidine-containing phosphotransfer) domain-containing protein
LIDIFLAQTPAYIDQLTAAIDQKELERMAELAHKIKQRVFYGVLRSAKTLWVK